ncbi:MAG: division/cell wall cluster transcriptional repressor MraZ [Deltaproteobacteria bacterium RIFOXYA12_FULL_58_15]|nr:MAG: division/cell wall cluster transcriptional repressor MraZ [Deltaproteobacteria bacterium RIFOXYA12_FULL_58_15]OGR11791.1 MAG: division/cell wall cluster transcriptional repressor MraZ [Deltaproteobacteria bacterium RIFOXYB12_FULL_58_9]
MFRGLYEHTIDAKGRTSLPVRFRETLEQSSDDGDTRLIVTTGIDKCLVAYPVSEWDAFETRLAALSQFDPAVVTLKRIYVAGATDCTIDKHGRLLIPPMLREYAGLSRDVVWAGMVTFIEIWSKDYWTQQAMVSRQSRDAVARALTELGL